MRNGVALSMHDKEGGRMIYQNRVDLFRDFLYGVGLMDFELKGCKFTWASNPRNGEVIRERIDRVLTSWAWRFLYPYAFAISLPSIGSDHSPIILRCKTNLKTGTDFKYEAYWEDHQDCNKVIEEGWNSASGEESPW